MLLWLVDGKQMLKAFGALDRKLHRPANLLLGGGGAMVLAYGFPLATQDLDAVFYKSAVSEGDIHREILQVARELDLPADWLNPHFQTFLYTLPQDYEARLQTVFAGKHLRVNALGLEDLLILKCFAGREKDIPHARALIRKGADEALAMRHIRSLIDRTIPKSQEAADFLDDVLDTLEEG